MREFIHNYDQHIEQAFQDFKGKHNKVYGDEKEHIQRLHNFRQNIR